MPDLRCKSESEWTFYVVDHLPTMNKLYRFDTVDEAIAKFKELPATAISALGSSKDSITEIDHIHRRNGSAVLVTDSDRIESSIWRNSDEIQMAIDKMVAALNVEHELSSDIFGSKYPPVAIPIERYQEKIMDRYFEDKILSSSKVNHPLYAVNEVFVAGEGWINRNDFFATLDDCRPKMDGKGAKTLFVEKLNIRYVNQSGNIGQADISPLNFRLLKEKTKRYLPVLTSDHSKSLSELIQDADVRSKQSQTFSHSHNKEPEIDDSRF